MILKIYFPYSDMEAGRSQLELKCVETEINISYGVVYHIYFQ